MAIVFKIRDILNSKLSPRICYAQFFIIYFALLQPCLLSAQFTYSDASKTNLYDASLGTHPDGQGWLFVSNLFDESETVRFTENGLHSFNTLADISEQSGYFGINHPGIDLLMKEQGLNLIFDLQIIDENSLSVNRGGFSIILLTDDLLGLELVFKKDSIWVYTSDFLIGEVQPVNTASDLSEYSISITEGEYEIFIDGILQLNGPLRDYSGFGPPYNIPNFIFFGDNTSSAGVHIHLSQIILETDKYIPEPMPEETVLYQNAPNPFTNQTVIEYSLAEPGEVRVDVFDVSGRLITTLVHEQKQTGTYRVIFDGAGLSSGIYLYRLQVNQKIFSKKFLLIK